jgi:hypothetical protein
MEQNSVKIKSRRRLKKPVKKALKIIVRGLLIIILFFVVREIMDRPVRYISGNVRVNNFKDINDVHLRFAGVNGITPIKSGAVFNTQVDELVKKDKLVRITDTKYYVVNKLSHSHPYLVPKGQELLEMIGKRFQKKLKEHQKEDYLFRVSSLLRTQESQKKLRHYNMNATFNSAHLYGTTFDITYRSLIKKSFFGAKKVVYDGAAIALLSEAIGELRNEKKLVVVTERKEACFHITLRN